MIRSGLLPFLLLIVHLAPAQPPNASVPGRWTTVDDNTDNPRSIVEISITNGTLSGRIVDLYD